MLNWSCFSDFFFFSSTGFCNINNICNKMITFLLAALFVRRFAIKLLLLSVYDDHNNLKIIIGEKCFCCFFIRRYASKKKWLVSWCHAISDVSLILRIRFQVVRMDERTVGWKRVADMLQFCKFQLLFFLSVKTISFLFVSFKWIHSTITTMVFAVKYIIIRTEPN